MNVLTSSAKEKGQKSCEEGEGLWGGGGGGWREEEERNNHRVRPRGRELEEQMNSRILCAPS